MEAEAIIVSYYVVMSELGYGTSSNKWNEEMEDYMLEKGIPSIENVGSPQYQSMFNQSVKNMKSYYIEAGINAPTYTSEKSDSTAQGSSGGYKKYCEK